MRVSLLIVPPLLGLAAPAAEAENPWLEERVLRSHEVPEACG